MKKEDKEKIEKQFDKIIENFPYEKYQHIFDTYMKLFEHLPEKSNLLEYVKKNLLDKQDGG